MQATTPARERGATTLIVTLVLFFVMSLIAAYANRNHVFEQRASANQYRATQAFEAADAGIEWAIAMLNNPQTVDERCQASSTAASSFRERYLQTEGSTGMLAPVTWNDGAGAPTPLRAVCVRHGDDWDCACPSSGAAHPTPGAQTMDAPAFSITFTSQPRARTVRVTALGCTSLAAPCDGGTATDHAEARSTIAVTLALLPGLATAPAAPLTVRGDVQVSAASIGLQHLDATTGGVTVHAGGTVNAPNARLLTSPGSAAAASVVEGDAALAGLTNDRLFASLFGLDKTLWPQHPAVRRVRCATPCNEALLQASQTGSANRLVWVDGDMRLQGPLDVGTRERPVVLVASGAVELVGAVNVTGLVYASSIAWQASGGAEGVLRGAAIAETGYQGDAAPELIHDHAVLQSLRTRSGSFARVPGSWRDF